MKRFFKTLAMTLALTLTMSTLVMATELPFDEAVFTDEVKEETKFDNEESPILEGEPIWVEKKGDFPEEAEVFGYSFETKYDEFEELKENYVDNTDAGNNVTSAEEALEEASAKKGKYEEENQKAVDIDYKEYRPACDATKEALNALNAEKNKTGATQDEINNAKNKVTGKYNGTGNTYINVTLENGNLVYTNEKGISLSKSDALNYLNNGQSDKLEKALNELEALENKSGADPDKVAELQKAYNEALANEKTLENKLNTQRNVVKSLNPVPTDDDIATLEQNIVAARNALEKINSDNSEIVARAQEVLKEIRVLIDELKGLKKDDPAPAPSPTPNNDIINAINDKVNEYNAIVSAPVMSIADIIRVAQRYKLANTNQEFIDYVIETYYDYCCDGFDEDATNEYIKLLTMVGDLKGAWDVYNKALPRLQEVGLTKGRFCIDRLMWLLIEAYANPDKIVELTLEFYTSI